MNTTRELQQAGQSLWLDNITRGILEDGALTRYIQKAGAGQSGRRNQ